MIGGLGCALGDEDDYFLVRNYYEKRGTDEAASDDEVEVGESEKIRGYVLPEGFWMFGQDDIEGRPLHEQEEQLLDGGIHSFAAWTVLSVLIVYYWIMPSVGFF